MKVDANYALNPTDCAPVATKFMLYTQADGLLNVFAELLLDCHFFHNVCINNIGVHYTN